MKKEPDRFANVVPFPTWAEAKEFIIIATHF